MKIERKTNQPRVQPCGTRFKKIVTKEMMDNVRGSRKHVRIKAAIIDILSDGDSYNSQEIWEELTDTYNFSFYESIEWVGQMCARMPQVEKLGTELQTVRNRARYHTGAYKKQSGVWALKV